MKAVTNIVHCPKCNRGVSVSLPKGKKQTRTIYCTKCKDTYKIEIVGYRIEYVEEIDNDI